MRVVPTDAVYVPAPVVVNVWYPFRVYLPLVDRYELISVSTEVLKLETADEVMDIGVLTTLVTCPCEFVVITGTCDAEPYVPDVPAVTDKVLS